MNRQDKIIIDKLSFRYRNRPILEDISLCWREKQIIAVTGPSGTGKSTFLSLFNRLWEETGDGRLTGSIQLNLGGGLVDIYQRQMPLATLRRSVGMVFQAPNPLPMSIYKNITFPLMLAGRKNGEEMTELVERVLTQVHLFAEVKDRLKSDARNLSGGQQQRLCLARALVLEPKILLLDEPTSSLDQEACRKLEELIVELKDQCTILLVSHYQDQVQRTADLVYELADKRLRRVG
ncbi:phosphate ABC transporter ATP-binding protein [Desulforhopalus singaporensis]|uniref:Phosphate ABC transporter ATP-binding protein, PhoT family n=1 Tax=Desulforhopalus singaporensis TaxID=91360 RepID=A0A1H0URN8_9BACT|nr:phosphate ABC transporter ATP-binding protein [Desulforhopalus singaporensis]SDP68780.1 phosphate ABC transporter ATP-binding protein, PhoT family [Desulforhopalus singaporensis]